MQSITAYFQEHSAEYIGYVLEHLKVNALSVLIAIVIAVPLGIISTRFKWVEKISQWFWGTLRIIPSLAILILCLPIIGTGVTPAVVALSILAIPSILLNTTIAFETLPPMVIEAAEGMGMSKKRLFFIF